jgi:hypothetical protein
MTDRLRELEARIDELAASLTEYMDRNDKRVKAAELRADAEWTEVDNHAERLAVLEHAPTYGPGALGEQPGTTMTREEVVALIETMLCKCLPAFAAHERANNIAAALGGVTIK